MNNVNKELTAKELSILASFISSKLISLDAVFVARYDAWNTVRLHTSAGTLDINNTLQVFPLGETDVEEETGVLSVALSKNEPLSMRDVGTDTTTKQVDCIIQGIFVVNNSVKIYDSDLYMSCYRYTQAIVLKLPDKYLVLDKEAWFDETISVKTSSDISSVIYDESQNWQDDPIEDPGTHYEFIQEIVEL